MINTYRIARLSKRITNISVSSNPFIRSNPFSLPVYHLLSLRNQCFSTSTKDDDDMKQKLSTNKFAPTTSQYLGTISELSKARLSALVVSTTSFGYLSAAPVPINYTTLACASIGTALCSSSASTLNQVFEYERDSKMKRTSKRPLVTQDVVGLNGAIALAASTGVSGGSILYFGTDHITAALGIGNIALYAGVYTFLKPRSEWNTWVGAVVGAVPPVMVELKSIFVVKSNNCFILLTILSFSNQ